MTPYYADNNTTVYCGDCRDVVPTLRPAADIIIADPPYEETAQRWDRWQDGWVSTVRDSARAMWCFGSLRMFDRRRLDFVEWTMSQDLVWSKPSGTGFVADRFVRCHELILHWYRGTWGEVYHNPPKETVAIRHRSRIVQGVAGAVYEGKIGSGGEWVDDGTRLARSVIESRNMRGIGRHPNEKPVRVLAPLIEYGCPPGGLVLDPFGGSGATAEAARMLGRRSVIVEQNEQWCEVIAKRMMQQVLI